MTVGHAWFHHPHTCTTLSAPNGALFHALCLSHDRLMNRMTFMDQTALHRGMMRLRIR